MDRRIRIVDFSTHLSGPMASHLLIGLGADVVKIENPRTGDGNRGMPPFVNGYGIFHAMLNAGARSLAIDKGSPHWTDVIAAATRWADAVIVGARPQDADRMGLGFDALAEVNPRLIYCQISGYGEEGPWSNYTAHGQQPDAWAGYVPIRWVDGLPETEPRWRSAGTTLAGVFAALGIVSELASRRGESDGEGPRKISVSLWRSAMWWQWRDFVTYATNGVEWPDYSNLGSRYALYPTQDERAILLAPSERKFWHSFVDILELPPAWKNRGNWGKGTMDMGAGPEYAEERAAIAAITRTKPLAAWIEAFSGTDIPFSPVLDWRESFESEHAAKEGIFASTMVGGKPTTIMATPAVVQRMDGAIVGPGETFPPPPELGADTTELLHEFGLDHLIDEWR